MRKLKNNTLYKHSKIKILACELRKICGKMSTTQRASAVTAPCFDGRSLTAESWPLYLPACVLPMQKLLRDIEGSVF